MDDTTTEPAWEPAPVDPTWLSAEHVFESEMKDDRRTDAADPRRWPAREATERRRLLPGRTEGASDAMEP